VAHEAFLTRALGVARTRVRDITVRLSQMMLAYARHRAAMVLLAAPRFVEPGLFEAVTTRAYGIPLPSALRGAWPWPTSATYVRFLVQLDAARLSTSLVERFDEDWFRNPRAARDVEARYLHARPSEGDHGNLREDAERFARLFEERLA
jgi:hypothetical protein